LSESRFASDRPSSRALLDRRAVDAETLAATLRGEGAQIGAGIGRSIAPANAVPRSAPGENLTTEPTERCRIVDVVPHGKRNDVERDARGSLDGLAEHVFRAPSDVLEESPMRLLQADEVVAAVQRGSEDDAVARRVQRLGCLDQDRRGKRWAVGVHKARA